LEYGEKVMLLGSNGSGKTTLFKLLLGEEIAQEGTMEMGARVDIGYLAQQEYRGDEKKTVLDYFREEAGMEEGEARSRLARYLFYGADVFKSVNQLSGGESTRLRLALLVLRKPNLLMLDEPTNHMDIASREALEEALEEYPGTLLAITHDRYFINRLAGKIWELDQGHITVFQGDFDAYKEKSEQLRANSSSSSGQYVVKPLISGKVKPQLDRATPPKRSRFAKTVEFNREQCEREIANGEERLAHLDWMLQEQAANPNAIGLNSLWNEREEVQDRLNLLYEQWMESENSNH
jgi:ATP-binding cassette subfamily F protein 3